MSTSERRFDQAADRITKEYKDFVAAPRTVEEQEFARRRFVKDWDKAKVTFLGGL